MADQDDDAVEGTPGYVAPAKVGLEEMKSKDADDEALNRWKAKLLEGASAGGGEPKVVPVAMEFISSNEDGSVKTLTMDLTGDLTQLKVTPWVIKQACEYKIKIDFKIEGDVISGLKYCQGTYRKGIRLAKDETMMGSYGPKTDVQTFTTPLDDMPAGMMARGHYTVKSKFVDDDAKVHLKWEWAFDLKKEWE